MKRRYGAMAVLGRSALLILLVFISACGGKLINVDESVSRLNLSEEQLKIIKPKLEAVKEISGVYDQKKEAFQEEINDMTGGDSGRERHSELRAKFQEFRKQREIYLSAINAHVAGIKDALNEEQLAVFEKLDLPKLEMPEMPGGQRRGGGRGGGRGGKGGGMGGGRRGGGMF